MVEAQLLNVAVHVDVKVGGRLVTIVGRMVCFHLFCSTFKPLRCLKDRLQVSKVLKACDPLHVKRKVVMAVKR